MSTIKSLPAVAGIEKMTPEFLRAFAAMIDRLGWSQNHADMLASLISHESGFRADALNQITKKHAGLLQFSPDNYSGRWGLSLEQVLAMTPTEQLDLVEKYFAPIKGIHSRDIAMAGLGWGLGMPDDVIVWSKDGTQGERDAVQPKGYVQNPGLDRNKDGLITLGEIREDVAAPLARAATRPRVPIPPPGASTGPGAPSGGGDTSTGGALFIFGIFFAGIAALKRWVS